MPDTTLIVHVKGTEETRALPKTIVRAAIAQGQISRSQLIWSPTHNAWKQVRELPHLLPSQKMAPAPQPRVAASAPLPSIAAPQHQTGAVPRVTVKAKAMPGAHVPAARAATPAKFVATKSHLVEEDPDSGFSPLKWICIGLGVFIVGALGANFFFINQPLASKLSATPYANVTVYAHLGAFVQPGALIIHIRPSDSLTQENLVDFLITVAHNTPQPPNLYERISLTTSLTSQYTLSGFAWKELGDMAKEDDSHKEDYLLSQLLDGNGQALFAPSPFMNQVSRDALREKVWKAFLANFASK
jgi:hypothetical protein